MRQNARGAYRRRCLPQLQQGNASKRKCGWRYQNLEHRHGGLLCFTGSPGLGEFRSPVGRQKFARGTKCAGYIALDLGTTLQDRLQKLPILGERRWNYQALGSAAAGLYQDLRRSHWTRSKSQASDCGKGASRTGKRYAEPPDFCIELLGSVPYH